MPNQTTILAQHGLIKADTATPKDWETIDNIRNKRFSIPLSWEQIQQLLAKHPTIRPYLYLSTGLDGLVLLNTNTGETANTQPLIFENLSDENDSNVQHGRTAYQQMGQDHTHKNPHTTRQNRQSQTADRPRHRTGTNSPNGTHLPARPMERIARQAIPAHDGIERQKERGIPITPIRQAPRQVTPADQALHWGRGSFGEDVRQAYNSVQG